MQKARLKIALAAMMLCVPILPPASAEIRILGSQGGQVVHSLICSRKFVLPANGW